MPNVTIKLSKPLPGHNGPITEIVIREPNCEDLLEFGDPCIYARLEDGTLFPAEDKEAIKRYVNRLVDLDPLLLGKLSLADGLRIKDTVIGFFIDARLTSQTPST